MQTDETLVSFASFSGVCMIKMAVSYIRFYHSYVTFVMQWSHKLPERTVAGMLDLIKGKEFRECAGSELPSKHTVVDHLLRAEVCNNRVVFYVFVFFDTCTPFIGWR